MGSDSDATTKDTTHQYIASCTDCGEHPSSFLPDQLLIPKTREESDGALADDDDDASDDTNDDTTTQDTRLSSIPNQRKVLLLESSSEDETEDQSTVLPFTTTDDDDERYDTFLIDSSSEEETEKVRPPRRRRQPPRTRRLPPRMHQQMRPTIFQDTSSSSDDDDAYASEKSSNESSFAFTSPSPQRRPVLKTIQPQPAAACEDDDATDSEDCGAHRSHRYVPIPLDATTKRSGSQQDRTNNSRNGELVPTHHLANPDTDDEEDATEPIARQESFLETEVSNRRRSSSDEFLNDLVQPTNSSLIVHDDTDTEQEEDGIQQQKEPTSTTSESSLAIGKRKPLLTETEENCNSANRDDSLMDLAEQINDGLKIRDDDDTDEEGDNKKQGPFISEGFESNGGKRKPSLMDTDEKNSNNHDDSWTDLAEQFNNNLTIQDDQETDTDTDDVANRRSTTTGLDAAFQLDSSPNIQDDEDTDTDPHVAVTEKQQSSFILDVTIPAKEFRGTKHRSVTQVDETDLTLKGSVTTPRDHSETKEASLSTSDDDHMQSPPSQDTMNSKSVVKENSTVLGFASDSEQTLDEVTNLKPKGSIREPRYHSEVKELELSTSNEDDEGRSMSSHDTKNRKSSAKDDSMVLEMYSSDDEQALQSDQASNLESSGFSSDGSDDCEVLKTVARAVLKAPSAKEKRLFAKKRASMAKTLLVDLDRGVYNNQLTTFSSGIQSALVTLSWSKTLRTTAGQTVCKIKKFPMMAAGKVTPIRFCSIELNPKVLDCESRLRCTLAHELCHAAEWIIDASDKPGHGKRFRHWSRLTTSAFPSITITTKHDYVIVKKYSWKCSGGCPRIIYHNKRTHIDPNRHICAKCKSSLVPQHGPPAPLTEYQRFVQENMPRVKQQGGAATAMREIARLWKLHKEQQE